MSGQRVRVPPKTTRNAPESSQCPLEELALDSDSEQADALVAVHGLIDSLYLKELAKKVQRGLIGQHERGFATGSKTYGYRTIPVPDASGRKDPRGQPVLEGYRIEVDPPEADVVRQIFEWAADGVGLANIVSRLNVGGIPNSGAKRWTKTPVSRILQNERYLGRQIWGQRSVEREPGTGRKFMRSNPREEWRVQERPDLRILSTSSGSVLRPLERPCGPR